MAKSIAAKELIRIKVSRTLGRWDKKINIAN